MAPAVRTACRPALSLRFFDPSSTASRQTCMRSPRGFGLQDRGGMNRAMRPAPPQRRKRYGAAAPGADPPPLSRNSNEPEGDRMVPSGTPYAVRRDCLRAVLAGCINPLPGFPRKPAMVCEYRVHGNQHAPVPPLADRANSWLHFKVLAGSRMSFGPDGTLEVN